MQLHEAGYTRDDPNVVKDIPNIGQNIAPCVPKLGPCTCGTTYTFYRKHFGVYNLGYLIDLVFWCRRITFPFMVVIAVDKQPIRFIGWVIMDAVISIMQVFLPPKPT